MKIFKFLRKPTEVEPEKEYTIDSDGLKNLALAINGYSFDSYNYPCEVEADMQYLLGVADTLPNNKRMSDIANKVIAIKYLMSASFGIKEVSGDQP